jgi:hypothetical protein
MKKYIVSCLFLVFISLSSSAIDWKDGKWNASISIGASMGIGLNDNPNEWTANEYFPAAPSLSLDFCRSFRINESWSIGTGIGYSNLNARTTIVSFVFEDMIDPSQGFVSTPSTRGNSGRFTYWHHYLNVPMFVKKEFGERFNGQLSLIHQFHTGSNVTSMFYVDENRINSQTKSYEHDYLRTYIPTIGTSFEIGISKSFYIGMDFRYTLLEASKDRYQPVPYLFTGTTFGFEW